MRQNRSVRLVSFLLIAWVVCPAVHAAAEDTRVSGTASIPVLCYHRFGDYGAQDTYSISMDEFSQQMAIIHEENMTPMTVSSLAAAMRGESALPEKPVLITIDDGYRDFLTTAKPLLEQYGYTATLFVYTNFVGSRLGMTRDELQVLQAAGFEIGSHSASHPKLSKMQKNETPDQRRQKLKAELAGSRTKLQAWSHGEVQGLAYPYGLWNAEVADIAQAAGYELLFTVNPGTNTRSSDPRCLKRTMVLRGTRPNTFRAMLRVRDLGMTAWQPALGEPATAPLNGISMVLVPEIAAVIAPESLQAMSGSTRIPLQYDAVTGRIALRFAKPWTRGNDLIVLTAQDRNGMLQYKQSRLVQVLPANP